jgi:hypothetical protein
MSAMTNPSQLFKALAESGMHPESARLVEREVQTSIDQGIEHHRHYDHTQVMTRADGLALELRITTEMGHLEGRLMRYIHDFGWRMMGFQVALLLGLLGLMLTAIKWMLG